MMPLNLRIRSHKIAIILMASLLINVLAIKSTYSQQNCQNVQTSIQSIDETGGRQFSGTDGMAQCHGDLKSSPEVKLFFVYRRLVTSVSPPIEGPFNLERTQSNGTRYLDSPWVKLTFSRSPRLVVRAVFPWSERQFMFDQALMSGIRASPTNSLLPIDEPMFEQFVKDYTDSVLFAPSQARPAALASISKRLPPEILWLFRHAFQSTRGPFSRQVKSALVSVLERGASGYTELTKALVDQFFTSAQTEIRYESVLDLKDIFTLDQYRVKNLY
ncbi:MAG: hypothetical protein JGK35_25870 [Microcoleus sp. PH2017_16_JOR_D_A]|uniref:hypothetical protein n=3 Tax=Microcoleus TaxID=44471 RepID=UPI001DBC022F|nr:hypothetical protein [Microcoleus sp. PH2017_16_JOR_D_A]MCC3493885.1 hypothetical protein [Microcoleus sp. PH2017_16_JOR_D_A]